MSATVVAAVWPGSAWGAPIQRGDLLASRTGGGLAEYTPTGRFVQKLARAAVRCIDPSGEHLIAPGIGLFDSSGKSLPSNWRSVPSAGCVADGLGNVYVNGRGDWTVKKYDLDGNPIQTFQLGSVSQLGQDGPTAIDLAPDECTLYYGVSEGMYGAIGRFNVCASVQEASFAGPYAPTDGLRVLPNWQVVSQGDPGARLLDTSGQSIRKYSPPPGQGASPSNSFRTIGLAADGRSVWMCCGHTASHGLYHAWRFDINGGAPLSVWPALSAVYGPPLLGDANVESTVDSTPAGTAEAFCTQVGYSGPMTRLHLWVDSSSTAHQLVVGIYSDRIERPSILLEHATITNVRPGSWNYADIRSMAVSDGQRYWIAVLAPSGDGAARFRVTARGKRSQTSARHNLTGLPGRWSGPAENPASLSGYGS